MTKKEHLNKLINDAIKYKAGYVWVLIKNKECEGNELIINPNENIKYKLEYYNKAYNDELQLNNNINIVIVEYGWSLDESTFEIGMIL